MLGLLLEASRVWPQVLSRLNEPIAAGLLCFWLVVFACAAGVAARREPFPATAFLLGYLAVSGLLHGLYLFLVRPELVSDFEKMWNFALEFVAGNPDAVVAGLQDQRALPVLVPAIAVFGASPWVYKIVNVVLLTAASLLHYDLLRRWFSLPVAQGFLVCVLCVPEFYFASAITSHDVSGLFFLSTAFWLANSLQDSLQRRLRGTDAARPWLRVTGLSLALGGALLMLDIQRGLSSIVLLAIAAILVAEWWQRSAKSEAESEVKSEAESISRWRQLSWGLVTLVIVPWLVMSAGLGVLAARKLLPSDSYYARFTAENLGNHGDSFSTGTHRSFTSFRIAMLRPLTTEEAQDLALHRSLSDVYYDAAAHRPANYALRAQRLFSLGSQGWQYYWRDTVADSPLSGPALGRVLHAANEAFVAVLCVAAIAALSWVLLVIRPPFPSLLPVTFLAGMAAVLLLVGENQPRYMFPLWLIVPSFIAVGAAGVAERGVALDDLRRLLQNFLKGPALVLGVLALAWLGIRIAYDVEDGRILRDWRIASNTGIPEDELRRSFAAQQLGTAIPIPGRKANEARTFGSQVTTLRLPRPAQAGDYLEATQSVCSPPDGRRSLAFHIWSPAGETPSQGRFELSVRGSDRTALVRDATTTRLGEPIRLRQIFGKQDCVDLAFRLTAVNPPANGEAPTVHLYFVRLVP